MSALLAIALSATQPVPVAHRVLTLTAPDGRAIPVQVYLPAKGCRRCTLIIFSHGNFATPRRYDVLLDAWAAHGMVVAAPLHTDSEEYPDRGRYPDSRATRFADWLAVDAAMRGHRLKHVSFSGKVIAAGHSYGALIAEVIGGARMAEEAGLRRSWRVPAAVIAISPPGAMPAFVPATGFAAIARPTLVVTGTADTLPGFIDRWQQHLESYLGAPAGLGYALTFAGMNHYFNGAYGRPMPAGESARPQVARLNRAILAFIDATVAGRPPRRAEWTVQTDASVKAEAR